VVGVAAILAAVAAALGGHRCRRVIVRGHSMAPTLLAGDRILVVAGRRLRRGDIVAVPDPRRAERLLMKRVTHIAPGRHTVSLSGDNAAASTDSRTFGPVPRRAILGRAVYRYGPAERAGRIDISRRGRAARSVERYHRPGMAGSSFNDMLDPEFLVDLPSLAIDQLRARRVRATEVEVGLSYVRRLIQGRLDIVLDEARRRESGGAERDISDLVERLPEILGDHVRAPGMGRLPTLMAPGESNLVDVARLDAIVDPDRLAALPRLDDADLRSAIDALAELERDVSERRRAMFDVIDKLQDELVRRYKSGEATVDNLLS
jgi:nickel-type superoxide dismutase maturation protease